MEGTTAKKNKKGKNFSHPSGFTIFKLETGNEDRETVEIRATAKRGRDGDYLTIQALLRLLVILVEEEGSGDRRDGGAGEERR